MDRETLFGGNPLGVIVRLVLISIVVGIVMSALDITPANLIYRLQVLVRRISDLGFGIFESAGRYLLLGAVIVVPVWLIARLIGVFGTRGDGQKK
jgi:Family of unknown function (DUF6460)